MCVVVRSVEGIAAGFFFFQAEDGIRGLVRSRGLGDVYKRQILFVSAMFGHQGPEHWSPTGKWFFQKDKARWGASLSLIHI